MSVIHTDDVYDIRFHIGIYSTAFGVIRHWWRSYRPVVRGIGVAEQLLGIVQGHALFKQFGGDGGRQRVVFCLSEIT